MPPRSDPAATAVGIFSGIWTVWDSGAIVYSAYDYNELAPLMLYLVGQVGHSIAFFESRYRITDLFDKPRTFTAQDVRSFG